ncbi:uncharacterized protein N7484_001843 [Penicillium longicatenatum]|uniref:uncharacterized protein n=1 Tax=Penicillium longicatenatum TaxID=1561947 RepID=UPI002548D006|nr:uncharacterized protein N7484_001843 [Penicillium longicatenatum]KAJ5658194.1 hypothetical protein N7484_001843 [Penicillium longicatenatum]
MSADRVLDKKGETLTQGDYVHIKSRGGHREGEVDKIVTDQEGAQAERVVNPPKLHPKSDALSTQVIFTDQHGHRVSHNPQSVDKQPRVEG